MPPRTTPRDARRIEDADDLEFLVQDKRAGWRADGARARRRQRRYKKLLTRALSAQEPGTAECSKESGSAE